MELKLKCKTITPMFMAGADGKTPELRSSEFKGMMRWWWRAIKADDDIGRLRKEEAEIFGGTGEGEGKSKVRVVIGTNLENPDIIEYQPLPHHEFKNCPIDKSVKCSKAFKLKAINVDKQIEIKFLIPTLTKEIESLIYLIFILGGFGKRSRRGFGSLEIIEPSISVTLEQILESLNCINNSYEIVNSPNLNGLQVIRNKNVEKLKNCYPWIQEIIISRKVFSDYNSILKAIGKASHDYSDPSLGYVNPRMASPIYVSTIKINNNLKPIITVLHPCFPESYPRRDFEKQQQFIRELAL